MPTDGRVSDVARVLVYVQDHDIRALLAVSLDVNGHEVTSSPDAGSALDLAGREAFDLVVLDDDDRRPSGREVARDLCSGAHPRPPVIMLTNQRSHQGTGSAPVPGIDQYVNKPFRVDHLLDAVHRLVAARPA